MLSVFSIVEIFLLWVALDTLLWSPYALQLNQLGYRTFDKDTIALLMAGPFIVAGLLFASGVLENFLAAWRRKHSRGRSFLVMVILPTLAFCFAGSMWEFPLSGVSLFVVAAAGWAIYDYLERRAGT